MRHVSKLKQMVPTVSYHYLMVSSVVLALIKKFGYAPTVAILAENDIDVRAVVCAEFGYRADEQ